MNPSDSAILEPPASPPVAPPPLKKPPRVAAPPQASKPPIPQPEKPPEEEKPLQERVLWSAPGWLVSMVAHLIVLVVLALCVIPPPPEWSGTQISADAALPPETLVEAVEFKLEQFTEAPAVASQAFAAAMDVSSVAVGGESMAAVATEVELGDVDVGGIETSLFGASGTALKESGGPKGEASFFGVKSSGRRFVFVVDSSNSMRNGKFDAAKEELLYAVRRLSPDQFFYVIFFDHDAERMTLTPGGEPDPTAVSATVANIKRLETWLATVKNELRTDPGDAMKFAVEMLPDAIFLLSDGQFTDRGRTERYLAENNVLNDPVDGRKPKVVINTLAFWARDGEPTMKKLAELYRGTYRFVPPNGK